MTDSSERKIKVLIEPGIYNLKEEFFKMIGVTMYSYKHRKKDVLLWLNEFFDYELLNTKPIKIHIKAVIGEYQPLPRKGYDKSLTEQKEKEYTDFTIHALAPEYTLNSYSKVAREAIEDFGYEKYKHTNAPWVVRKFVKPVMDEYGERTEELYWADYYSYEALTNEEVEKWYYILEKYRIAEKEAANAFYRQEQGEDISEEKDRYKKALDEASKLLGIFPIKVPKWRLKQVKE